MPVRITPIAISASTRRRDRYRTPAQRRALELTRQLSLLATRFPEFAPDFNRLIHRIHGELRPTPCKEKMILTALQRFDILRFDELIEETRLDHSSLTRVLASMLKAGRIQLCARDGRPYAPAGRPTDVLGLQRAAERTFLRLKNDAT